MRRSLTTSSPESIRVSVGGRSHRVASISPLQWYDDQGEVAFDAAIVELETTPDPPVSSAGLLVELDDAGWARLRHSRLFAIGHDASGAKRIGIRGQELHSPQADGSSGWIEQAAMNVRAVGGFSGGALCVLADGETVCLGMLVLGGDLVGTSVVLSSDAIWRALDRLPGGRPVDVRTIQLPSVKRLGNGRSLGGAIAPGLAAFATCILAGMWLWNGPGATGNTASESFAAKNPVIGSSPVGDSARPAQAPPADEGADTVAVTPVLRESPSLANEEVQQSLPDKPAGRELTMAVVAEEPLVIAERPAPKVDQEVRTVWINDRGYEYQIHPQYVGDPGAVLRVANQRDIPGSAKWGLPSPDHAYALAEAFCDHRVRILESPLEIWTNKHSTGLRMQTLEYRPDGSSRLYRMRSKAMVILSRPLPPSSPSSNE